MVGVKHLTDDDATDLLVRTCFEGAATEVNRIAVAMVETLGNDAAMAGALMFWMGMKRHSQSMLEDLCAAAGSNLSHLEGYLMGLEAAEKGKV